MEQHIFISTKNNAAKFNVSCDLNEKKYDNQRRCLSTMWLALVF